MSFTMHGIPVSGGIAIGHAHLVSHAKLEVAHYDVPPEQIAGELARFDAAGHRDAVHGEAHDQD
jgi:phosphotransferase system enzyme I (PtsI)